MANSPLGLNPRDKRPGERRTFGASRRPAGVWYVVGLLLLMVIAQTFLVPKAADRFDYSEFKQAIRDGQVAEVTSASRSSAASTSAKSTAPNFNANRIEDPKLLEHLDAASVKYTGEFVSRWLPEIVPGCSAPAAASASGSSSSAAWAALKAG